MHQSLETFCRDCARILRADPGPGGKERIRAKLGQLLQDADFVAAHVGPDAAFGVRKLYEDPDLGFCVLAHVLRDARASPPHDHGTSWAIYGQASGWTDMTEYRRAGGGTGAGPAELEATRRYRLEPGEAGLFDVGEIHAIEHPAGARFVRVTGTDLERVPRLKFDLEGRTASVMQSATTQGGT